VALPLLWCFSVLRVASENTMIFFHPSRNNPASVAAAPRPIAEHAGPAPDPLSDPAGGGITRTIFRAASRVDRIAIVITRVGLIVVLIWIGGLEAVDYEAEGIAPIAANMLGTFIVVIGAMIALHPWLPCDVVIELIWLVAKRVETSAAMSAVTVLFPSRLRVAACPAATRFIFGPMN
jgi:hypothetical protein